MHMNKINEIKEAEQAWKEGRASDMVRISDSIISSDDDYTKGCGYIIRGLAYEFGGQEVVIDLPKALDLYRQAAVIQQNQHMPYFYMAMVLMKMGGSNHIKAFRYLEEARALKVWSSLDLAYGSFYEGLPEPDYEKARKYYGRAALRGRARGFFGYSRASRAMGLWGRALLVDVVRIIIGPFLYILLGKKAINSY